MMPVATFNVDPTQGVSQIITIALASVWMDSLATPSIHRKDVHRKCHAKLKMTVPPTMCVASTSVASGPVSTPAKS